MKRINEKDRLILMVLIIMPSFFLVNESISNAQSFKLSAVSDMVRVFDDGYKLPAMNDSVNLFGIRGEIISGQFTINTRKDLEKVKVETGVLKNMITGISLPPDAVSWNFVGSIPLAKNSPNQPLKMLVRQAPANFPDYLMAERQLDIKGKTWKSVWLTVRIPGNTKEGTYSGHVSVTSGRESSSIPFSLTIYPLTMPDEHHLKVVEWYSTTGFSRFHDIQQEYTPEWFGMLRKYAENMAEHRQNVFEVPMHSISISKNQDGIFEFDFSKFDQIAEVFWATKKMDYLETGELFRFGEGGFSSTEINPKEFPVKSYPTGDEIKISGNEIIPHLLPAFERHLREKGWLDRTLFHIKDEPSHHNAINWIEASSTVHKYAPDLKRIDAVCTSYLFGNIEIAIPKLDHLDAGYEIYRKEQQKGNELWFYTVGIYQGSGYPNKTIDMPLIDTRLLHWINYRYDLAGYLHWGWNQWGNDDPYQDAGMHAGDAWHVYPAKDGILNSLRWEEMRNGIQDYEYFVLLEKKISSLKDSLGSKFLWIDPGQRGKEIINQVVMRFKDHSDDPELLYKSKKELINEILNFNTSPSVYVQTSPPEHGKVINRSPVELLGWTEPGTEITVNGIRIPVSADGIFMERYLLYVGDTLKIWARKNNKEKIITRTFNVTY